MMRREKNGVCRHLFGAVVAAALLTVSSARAAQVEPPEPPPQSLKTVPVPMPDNFSDCVTDLEAAIKLGKALFWDMQLGSDGKQACASCHFSAGVDSRLKNQINPGTFDDNLFDVASNGEGGPNSELSASAWPFHKQLIPDDNESEVLHDFDDAFASQGVKRVLFTGVNGTSTDDGWEEADPDGFSANGLNFRRVEPRNTPTMINAVYFHRLFHDGRASHFFNGTSPRGNQDGSAMVLVKHGAGPAVAEPISFNNAALASQAVGPPGSPFEMSWDGRDLSDIGKKMVSKFPLAGQLVHAQDSVFEGCVNPAGPGLTPGMTYSDMIKAAFDSKFWSDETSDFGGFSQMEKNFALFFGMACLAYESTLVSDDTPLDRYLDGGGEGGTATDELTAQEKEGFDIFMDRGECNACHTLPEMGGAAISQIAQEGLLELMAMENTGAEGCLQLSTTPVHDGANPLWFDPRNQMLEISGPLDYETGDYGTLLAGGFLFFQGTNPGECTPLEIDFPLHPFAGIPYDGANLHTPANMEEPFGVEVHFRVKANCKMQLEVCIETGFPGIIPGDYIVSINGAQMGVISMAPANPPAVYDSGFYNIGVTPTTRDIGNGGSDEHGPFSIAARVQNGEDIGEPTGLAGPLLPGDRIAVDGAFRAPQLRNIELTGPYMHNGGLLTLEQVVDFYTGGAHFFNENIADLDPEVAGIGGMDTERKAALAAFLKRPLTDERVRWEKAPFDHPQLFVAHGHTEVQDGGSMGALDDMVEVQAVGKHGAVAPLLPFHEQLLSAITVAPSTAVEVMEDTTLGAPRGTASQAATERKFGTDIQFGQAGEVYLYMHKAPDAPVRISPIVNGRDLICAPSVLTFNSTNWFEPQVVKLYGLTDELTEGDELQVLSWSVQSHDPQYSNFPLPNCSVMVCDQPVAPGSNQP